MQRRAVRRGLARRTPKLPKQIGVDETSFQRRHEYVTVIVGEAKVVSHVADGRGREVLDDYFGAHPAAEREAVTSVTMGMWAPYIESTRDLIPDADTKIAFDKFHVAQHLGNAADKVRRQEHRALPGEGDEQLKKTKYLLLRNPDNFTAEAWECFEPLRHSSLRRLGYMPPAPPRRPLARELGPGIWAEVHAASGLIIIEAQGHIANPGEREERHRRRRALRS